MMTPALEAESVTFVGYETRDSYTVAIFRQPWDERDFVLDQANTQARLSNLKREGQPCEVTSAVVAGWPRMAEEGKP